MFYIKNKVYTLLSINVQNIKKKKYHNIGTSYKISNNLLVIISHIFKIINYYQVHS